MLIVNLYSREDHPEAPNKTQKHKHVDGDKLIEREGKGKTGDERRKTSGTEAEPGPGNMRAGEERRLERTLEREVF
ncbi:hypothetical protein F2Q70_00022733 [Brassica cretica]|uniref:Uncharacterized protein n=1 Tax=Brassica cretica TaxID=69181 RepID=A0A8S9GFR4_BRACR|nr:hypothetical protein F2Q70_00022733 [Brassica cretica]